MKMMREVPGLALTSARYLIAENIAQKVEAQEPIAIDMTGFIAADIADGAILRKFNMDTPIRRIADGIVDHLSVGRVAFEVVKKYLAARPYIAVLAVRAAFVGALNAKHLVETGEPTKGEWNQKATNLATAAFTLIACTGNRKATHVAGWVTSGTAISTSLAHFKDMGVRHPDGIRKLH